MNPPPTATGRNTRSVFGDVVEAPSVLTVSVLNGLISSLFLCHRPTDCGERHVRKNADNRAGYQMLETYGIDLNFHREERDTFRMEPSDDLRGQLQRRPHAQDPAADPRCIGAVDADCFAALES